VATFPRLGDSKRAVPLVLLALALSAAVSAGDNAWTSIGPEGSSVNALAIDQRNPSTVYVPSEGVRERRGEFQLRSGKQGQEGAIDRAWLRPNP
jgi:hypothetical protein